MTLPAGEWTELLDWKRRIFAMYARIRSTSDPEQAWADFRRTRDQMFSEHPQSPIPVDERRDLELPYFDYDPRARVLADISPAQEMHYEIPTSGDGTYGFTRIAEAGFAFQGERQVLELYWLDGYGGGLFVPFRDGTAGTETYGAGRYLFDTIKGADLGMEGGRIVFDFNFAFNPSCAYDPRWVCPLAPPPNRLHVEIRA